MTKTLISLTLAGTLAVAGSYPVLTSASSRTPSSPTARLSGPSIVSTALSYVGYRYAYVGDTPYTGFSCTGFVHWVYSQYGYNTPEDVGVLYYSYPHVSSGDLQPGDVLIFANTYHAGLSHAAIYIGGGQMVGADNFSVGVHVDYLWDGYWGPRFAGAVRVAPYALPVASSPRQQATTAPAPRVSAAVIRQSANRTAKSGHSRPAAAAYSVSLKADHSLRVLLATSRAGKSGASLHAMLVTSREAKSVASRSGQQARALLQWQLASVVDGARPRVASLTRHGQPS